PLLQLDELQVAQSPPPPLRFDVGAPRGQLPVRRRHGPGGLRRPPQVPPGGEGDLAAAGVGVLASADAGADVVQERLGGALAAVGDGEALLLLPAVVVAVAGLPGSGAVA